MLGWTLQNVYSNLYSRALGSSSFPVLVTFQVTDVKAPFALDLIYIYIYLLSILFTENE